MEYIESSTGDRVTAEQFLHGVTIPSLVKVIAKKNDGTIIGFFTDSKGVKRKIHNKEWLVSGSLVMSDRLFRKVCQPVETI